MRTLAIGDVHGCSAVLDALLAAVAPTPADTLVFLGDYVDRGPDSRGVLDRVIELKRTHNVIALRGNHELMMCRGRDGPGPLRMWMGVGGTQTLGSYGKAPGRSGTLADVPADHWRLLDTGLVNYHETDTHIFVHAGLDPDTPMDEQSELMLFWANTEGPVRHPAGKTLVCGHTAQRTGEIWDLGDTVCIDTYAYGGGRLTCYCAETRDFWQANLVGKIFTGFLA